MNPTIQAALSMSSGEIGKLFDDVAPIGLQDLGREASALAQKAVWLREYLDFRGAAGFGDLGHYEAAVKADAKLKTVRKAMGYTYP